MRARQRKRNNGRIENKDTERNSNSTPPALSVLTALGWRVGVFPGRSLATKYGRIDTIREYFDVDANEVGETALCLTPPLHRYWNTY